MSEQGREMGEERLQAELRRGSQLLSDGAARRGAALRGGGARTAPGERARAEPPRAHPLPAGAVRARAQIFDSLVRRNPDVVTLRLNGGHAALGAGNLDRALDHFQRGVELDPGHGRAFGYLSLVHLRRREQHRGPRRPRGGGAPGPRRRARLAGARPEPGARARDGASGPGPAPPAGGRAGAPRGVRRGAAAAQPEGSFRDRGGSNRAVGSRGAARGAGTGGSGGRD